MIPKQCPICCGNSIRPILRDVLLSAYLDGSASHSPGASAYRCIEGHVFLVLDEGFRWEEPRAEGNGHSMMV